MTMGIPSNRQNANTRRAALASRRCPEKCTCKINADKEDWLAAAMIDRRGRRVAQRGLAPPQPNVDEAASFVNKTWNEVDEAGSSVYGRAPHKLPRLIMRVDCGDTEGQ